MSRLKISLSYNGRRYRGWQVQDNAVTVQGEFNECLQKVTRVSDTMGSGRTDAGVHAKVQFLHCDVDYEDLDELRFKLNTLLSSDVKINTIERTHDSFHARFDAISRAYEYHIHEEKDPFASELAYCFNRPLDVAAMNATAQTLLGEQNFQCFSKVKTTVNNFVCTIEEAKWVKTESGLMFYIRANRFLRGMVRAIVGTLMEVGLGKMNTNDFKAIMESRDRREAGRAVPPEGLFLVEVNYPEKN